MASQPHKGHNVEYSKLVILPVAVYFQTLCWVLSRLDDRTTEGLTQMRENDKAACKYYEHMASTLQHTNSMKTQIV